MMRMFLLVETALAGAAMTMAGAVAATDATSLHENTLVPVGVLLGGVVATAAAAWKVATYCAQIRQDISSIKARVEHNSRAIADLQTKEKSQ